MTKGLARGPATVILALACAGQALSPGPAAAPTSATITLDGSFDDWAEVLTNPANSWRDGDGASLACGDSTDRDCPVATPADDLARFGWTWDDRNLYFYVERFGAGGSWQFAFIYLDEDLDGLMEAAETVIRARFRDDTSQADVDAFDYSPADAAGDPMTDVNGLGDGYRLLGTTSGGGQPAAPGNGEAPGGRRYEFGIRWTRLQNDVGRPVGVHVATGTQPRPSSGLTDNMGGAGGGAGSTGFRDLSLQPPRHAAGAPGSVIEIAHELRNTGNCPLQADLVTCSDAGIDVDIWRDDDGDGRGDVLLATDSRGDGLFTLPGDVLSPVGDTDLDGVPDTGQLARGASLQLVLRQALPAGAAGLVENIAFTATAHEEPWITSSLTDVVRVGSVTIRQNEDRSGVAGDVAWMPHVVSNSTAADIRADLRPVSALGWTWSVWEDPDGDGSPADAVPMVDADASGLPDVLVPSGGERALFARASIPAWLGDGVTDAAFVRVSVLGAPQGVVRDTVVTRPPLELLPDHVLPDDARYAGPGGFAYFAHVVRNHRSSAEDITLTALCDSGWPAVLLRDPNGDGRPADAIPLAGPSVALEGNGGEARILLRVAIPAGGAVGEVARCRIDASSARGDMRAAEDDAVIAIVRVYEDALREANVTRFQPCATVYAAATNLNPGQARYRFVWKDPGGLTVRSSERVADSQGTCADELTLPPGFAGNGATVAIEEWTGSAHARLDIATWAVDTGVIATSLTVEPARLHLSGETVSAEAWIENLLDPVARSVEVQWVVRDDAGTEYLTAAGALAAYTGAEATATEPVTLEFRERRRLQFSVRNAEFRSAGAFVVELRLTAACGAPVLAASGLLTVVDDADLDGIDAAAESAAGTDPDDADSDDDGLLDGLDGSADSDGDGAIDALDCDSDGDGLPDGLEAGVMSPPAATDVAAGCFVADIWGVTTTDPDNPDTDGGGVRDGDEDANADGRKDAGERDPNEPADDDPQDPDGDGLPTSLELSRGTLPDDADSDDDGLLDGAEGTGDADGDGLVDARDCDADADGIFDGVEAGVSIAHPDVDPSRGCWDADIDPATQTDPLSADTDAGGVPDGVEDRNANGQRDAGEGDPLDPTDDALADTDTDGLGDLMEASLGTDPFDADTDDDGRLDGEEGMGDADGDGVPDARECDADRDGLPDGLEAGVTAAGPATNLATGCFIPDADPFATTDPARPDTDGGGVPDGIEDADRDGARDAGERDPLDPLDDGSADSDTDGLRDLDELALGTDPMDSDSDDDGRSDGAEPLADSDADGILDALECDADADGLPDGLEFGVTAPLADTDVAAGCFRADADPLTTTDPTRADTDGGGDPDGIEDADGDGARTGTEGDPLDPTDDRAGCARVSPPEVTGLRVRRSGAFATLSWDDLPRDACTTFRVLASPDPGATGWPVLATDLASPGAVDARPAPPGNIAFYAVIAFSSVAGAGPGAP